MIFSTNTLRKLRWRKFVCSVLAASLLGGCTGDRDKKLSYLGNADLNYYEGESTKIVYPDIDEPTPENVSFGVKPRMLGDRSRDQVRDITLSEAVHLALVNSKVVRVSQEFLSAGNTLYTNPDNVQSIYDPSIRDTGVLFGFRGVESALAQFDTQLNTSLLINRNSTIQNNSFSSGGFLTPGGTLDLSTATFNTNLQKPLAYGALATVTHNWNYNFSNLPAGSVSSGSSGRLFQGAYDGGIRVDYTQPLWAASGAEFSRIAGPFNTNIQGLSGVNQGVMIARINEDITIADFEIAVRNMLRDVENTYWELYLGYRSYDSQVIARNSALQTWRTVESKRRVGAKGGSAADEAQSREAYYDARSRAEDALQNIYTQELNLRRLLGLPSNDGEILRPKDEPITAEFIPEWHICLAEALTKREELRRQKWNIKSYDLQLIAAKNLANPRLDFVSSYQLNGFGNQLFGSSSTPGDPNAPFKSAYRTLFSGNQQGWGLGFQFSMPLGLRNALSQVHNVELRAAKARQVLAEQEKEVNHELANAFQNLAWRYKTAQTNFNRRRAAVENLEAQQVAFEGGTTTLDLLLQAQTRLAVAETAYFTSLVRYNQAVSDIHMRKGTLLENNNVHLSEGPWSPEAYADALRKAWARSYAFDTLPIDPIHHAPEVIEAQGVIGTAELVTPEGSSSLTSEPEFLRPEVPPALPDVPLGPEVAPPPPPPPPPPPETQPLNSDPGRQQE